MAAAKGLISITKTKESPDQEVSVTLKQDAEGVICIKKISKSGLFHHTELEVDDKVMSINGHRLAKNETLEDFMEATLDNENATKITIVAKKPSAWGKVEPEEEAKTFKKEFRLSAGGTPLSYDDERLQQEEEEKVQKVVKAKKEKEGQPVGVTFVKVGDKLFVSGIATDSIFHPDMKPKGSAELEFGDRIASVNDTNFMSYADGDYATKLLEKRSAMECVLYVEKGWNVLGPGHVDPIHFDPTLVRGGKARYAPKVEEEPEDAESEVEISDSEDEGEKEPEGSGIAKPDLKEVAPPPKDDAPLDGDKMWWDM